MERKKGGYGLYAGNPSGNGLGTGMHIHHHYHVSGKGMWDWADPNKNGVAKAFDPNQNGVAKAFDPHQNGLSNVVSTVHLDVPNKLQDLEKSIRDKMEQKGLNNKGAMKGLKTAGHYVIPAATGALGGLAGEALGGPLGGIAGSAAGSYAGSKINNAIGIGLHAGQGRFRKGSQEAKEHMARLRAMRKKH